MTEPIYMQKYPNLFKPLTVGRGKKKVTFKNRLMVGPMMSMCGQDVNGLLNEEGILDHSNFAKGGWASMAIPFEIPADGGHARALSLANEEITPSMDMHKLQRLVHAYGTKTFSELYHSGCCMIPKPGRKLLSASSFVYNGNQVYEMTEDDMEDVLKLYEDGARMIKRSGFDGIQLHFAHGWLAHNFLSPLTNKRTDKYGGSVENRCRFPLMIIERVRSVIGDDMPIELRMNGWDGEDEKNGITPEDAIQQMLIFQDYVDMIHITCGNRLDASTRPEQMPSHFSVDAHNAFIGEMAKKAGVTIPIGAIGKIHDPETAERLIAEGKADYVIMSRQAVADNNFVNKVKRGQEEDVRPCLHCNYCIDGGRRGSVSKKLTMNNEATFDIYCSVNPLFGQGAAKRYIPEPTEQKKVAIIGGGVAGMQAAITAAERGHEVTLYEKSDKLGGQLYFADYMWFKDSIKRFREWQIRQVYKKGVNVKLNTEATPELVEAGNPDTVIVAIGSKPSVPPIPGIDGANVRIARTIFGHEEELGKNLVIIGGGLVGCDTAIHLAGKGHNVTILEAAEFIARNAQLAERIATLKEMDKAGIVSHVEVNCREIKENGVLIADKDGNESFIEADHVLISTGIVPLLEEREKFQYSAIDVRYIGDCDYGGTIRQAVHSGYDAAMTVL